MASSSVYLLFHGISLLDLILLLAPLFSSAAMSNFDMNPLFDVASSASHDSSSTTSASSGTAPPPPPSAASLQMVNIKSHVPIVLNVAESNHADWCCFFDSVIGKFGLNSHIAANPTVAQLHNTEWMMVDQCLVNWLYNTISKDVMNIVRVPGASAFTIWSGINDIFRNNHLHRAVYLEAEFRSLYQGDMSISEYTSRLKELADALRDVGQPVTDQSQVLNLLRGLNRKFRHTIAPISNERPPHTFLSARSYLLLEDLYDKEHLKMESHQALLASHGGRTSGTAGAAGFGGSGSSSNRKSSNSPTPPKKKRGRGNSSNNSAPAAGFNTGASATGGAPFGSATQPPAQNQPWPNGYNPWTGMVQAWSMPIRAPGSGVLGPRPGTPAQ